MVRNLMQIENELIKIDNSPNKVYSTLRNELIKDLRFHIYSSNENNIFTAINIATDYFIVELMEDIAKHLSHENESIREIAVANLMGRFKNPKYAKIVLNLAQEDPDQGVRDLSISNLGFILPKISDLSIQKEIAEFLLNLFLNEKKNKDDREAAYDSIIISLDMPPKYWIVPGELDLDKDIDKSILNRFEKKYLKNN